MISKQQKQKILENIQDKEQRILIANVIDRANKSYLSNIVTNTNFLDLNDYSIISGILTQNNIKYKLINVNEELEKKILIFYTEENKYQYDLKDDEYISCIKVITNVKGKLKHKDYMGAIYSLGIKRDLIGDIFANDSCAYLFCMKSIEEYILTNLSQIGKQDAKVEILDIFSDEVKQIHLDFESIEIIVPSVRVDVILSEIYKLSRSAVKSKIERGDLYINSKNFFFISEPLKENDIVSFKKCGKFKFGSEIRKTKSGNMCVGIRKYI